MQKRANSNLPAMDAISWKLLEALQQNARLSFAELGRKVGLSTPAVAERVRRLEESGAVTGYHASVNTVKLGLPMRILVRLTIPGGELQISRTIAALKEMPEISRCHRDHRRGVVCDRGRCGVDPTHGGPDRQAFHAGRYVDLHGAVVACGAATLPVETDCRV